METPISMGHKPIDGLRYPDSEPAKMNCIGCQTARVNAALPDMDSPTTGVVRAKPRFGDGRPPLDGLIRLILKRAGVAVRL